jgi:hypothetical protein
MDNKPGKPGDYSLTQNVEHMKKIHQVVMLATEKIAKKGELTLNTAIPDLFIATIDAQLSYKQHLYLISDDEIKEGDWALNEYAKMVYQAKFGGNVAGSKKIIATTGTNLRFVKDHVHYNFLPQIPESFIQAYIKTYNEGSPITEVAVEYDHGVLIGQPDFILKLRSDNTVIIHQARTYTRDEVERLSTKAFEAGMDHQCDPSTNPGRETWLEKNL